MQRDIDIIVQTAPINILCAASTLDHQAHFNFVFFHPPNPSSFFFSLLHYVVMTVCIQLFLLSCLCLGQLNSGYSVNVGRLEASSYYLSEGNWTKKYIRCCQYQYISASYSAPQVYKRWGFSSNLFVCMTQKNCKLKISETHLYSKWQNGQFSMCYVITCASFGFHVYF